MTCEYADNVSHGSLCHDVRTSEERCSMFCLDECTWRGKVACYRTSTIFVLLLVKLLEDRTTLETILYMSMRKMWLVEESLEVDVGCGKNKPSVENLDLAHVFCRSFQEAGGVWYLTAMPKDCTHAKGLSNIFEPSLSEREHLVPPAAFDTPDEINILPSCFGATESFLCYMSHLKRGGIDRSF